MLATRFCEIRDDILSNPLNVTIDLLLRPSYDMLQTAGTPFERCKKQYIEHLIVYVASKSINSTDVVPPSQVEALWHCHLVETESYRNLEKVVIDKVNAEFPRPERGLEHIDYSAIKNAENRADRLRMTKNLYSLVGFDFSDEHSGDMETASSFDAIGQIPVKNSADEACSNNEIVNDEGIGQPSNLKNTYKDVHIDEVTTDDDNVQANYTGAIHRPSFKMKRTSAAGSLFRTLENPILRDGNATNLLELSSKGNDKDAGNVANSAPRKRRKRAGILSKARKNPREGNEIMADILTSLDIRELPPSIQPIKSKTKCGCYQGVTKSKKEGLWIARIEFNRLKLRLGEYDNEVLAAKIHAWARQIVDESKVAPKPRGDNNRQTSSPCESRKREGQSNQQKENLGVSSTLSGSDNALITRLKSLKLRDLPNDISPIESTKNKHGYAGINQKGKESFWATVFFNGRSFSIGNFDSALDAGRMHAWAKKIIAESGSLEKPGVERKKSPSITKESDAKCQVLFEQSDPHFSKSVVNQNLESPSIQFLHI